MVELTPNNERERGTILSWSGMGGRIRADNGDTIALYCWSIMQGFRRLIAGQRVEFSRVPLWHKRQAAALVTAIDAEE